MKKSPFDDKIVYSKNQDRWISLQEACVYLGVNHMAMGWIAQRGMPASWVGKLWRFKTVDIDEWVKNAEDSMSGRV